MGSYKMCIFFTRKFDFNEAQPPPDVMEAFEKFSEGESHMTAEQLHRFMVEFQGDADTTTNDAKRIIHKVIDKRHAVTKIARHNFKLEDFYYYLFSDNLNPPIHDQVRQNMNFPLSHYFIYTGHNSYLTGNQLSSDCSDVPIIKALKRGVRVIELDIWPNSSKDDVHVLHGRTLTTPVSLIKCFHSIKEHAFSTSPYPVVITLEDHLTPDLQAKVAEAECLLEFPSPEELKYRIILSTKPPKEYLESKTWMNRGNDPQGGKDSDEEPWGKEAVDPTAEFETDDKDDEDADDDDDYNSRQSGAPQYKRLIALHAGKPKGRLKEALTVESGGVTRLSLSEQELVKATVSLGPTLVRFTQKNFLRIYPKGTRFNSSNYNPLIGWMHGAQMVAFNMQGYGKSLWLMHGMFRANGGCGYVKKPDHMMVEECDLKVISPVKKTLKVRVYMGDGWHVDFKKTHFDSYSPPDFYTKVRIAGVEADYAKVKTKVVKDDWVPVWDEEFEFPLTVPEMALLYIEVREHDKHEKDDFGGQTCLPVSELRTGVRTVPLFDREGEKYETVRLLMRFQFV
ncbi:PREDICTED: phosphoinositide phospholipase C 4-like isoform X2 [Nelumbo nucifera]|uniref:Phosphoinositide phospholipase C n=1 Tax=Nelumbo nucifera TaxID=4432 RepID=A0A1U7ZYY2_NELNU|nr:PREDICTED: phosphoinositide phospholipase C 4-like isoform X2 [Nelumbo nucifera]